MTLSPTASAILAHLKARPSATMADLRKVTKLGTHATKEAAYELCRARLATAEWGGVRFRAKKPSICPPAATPADTSGLADDTDPSHAHPCDGALGAVGHIAGASQ